jgi:phosphoribosylformylglycinamidine cyclo-ligase
VDHKGAADPGAPPTSTDGAAQPPATYAGAGVDISAGEEAVERIRRLVASTATAGVLGSIGGFAGAFAFDSDAYSAPVLVASTDGVGTKALVAQAARRYDTIGVDLVAMCVDDLVCVGARPLFLLDYLVTGKLDPDQMEQLVTGVAEGCRRADCALLGGEMAEHAGALEPGGFDLAGFAVGVVEREAMLGAGRVEVGDVLVGLESPGLRSNGYTLARHVLLERGGRTLDTPAFEGSVRSLADELLLPSVVYAPAVLQAVAAGGVRAAAHITGGGIVHNLGRAIPDRCDAIVQRSRFVVPRIFSEIQRLGHVEDEEMARVFNLGIGMVLVVAPDAVRGALSQIEQGGCRAAVVGSVVEGTGRVRFEN